MPQASVPLHPLEHRSSTASFIRRVALTLFIALGAAQTAHAVTVSPAALYLNPRTRSGMLTLYNAGSLPEEIEINFAFGYPRSDALGNIGVALADTAPAGEPSLIPWVRAFPRRLRLEPGQRQVIRVMVNPPADLPPGEYWARITILSRGGQPPIEQRQGGVAMRIDLQTQVVAAISYRNGEVTTGVKVDSATARPDSSMIRVTIDVSRTGSAAWLGHAQYELLTPAGQRVGEVSEDLAVYRGLRRVVEFPRPIGPVANYGVRFTFSTTRPDLPPEGPIQAATVTGVIPVVVAP